METHRGRAPGEATDSREKRTTHSYAKQSKRRSEEHTSELQSQFHLVCRLLLEKKKKKKKKKKFNKKKQKKKHKRNKTKKKTAEKKKKKNISSKKKLNNIQVHMITIISNVIDTK